MKRHQQQSIHPSSITASAALGVKGCRSQSQLSGGLTAVSWKTGCHLPVHRRATQRLGPAIVADLQLPVSLIGLWTVGGSQPGSHADTCKDPAQFLLGLPPMNGVLDVERLQ